MKPDKFMLNVRVEIEKISGESGYNNTGERLSVSEQIQLKPGTFLEAMGMLGRFHELCEKIKTEA